MHLPDRSPIPSGKKQRQALTGIMKKQGTYGAYWLAYGYAAFDHTIPAQTGHDGIYAAPERLRELHQLSSLTPDLDAMTRIQIAA